jgi:hypothetical protein
MLQPLDIINLVCSEKIFVSDPVVGDKVEGEIEEQAGIRRCFIPILNPDVGGKPSDIHLTKV